MLVNCLLNAFAICVGEVNDFSLKVMVLFAFLYNVNVCLYCCSLDMVRVLIVVIMGRLSEFSACIMCQIVRLYNVVEIVVMFGEVACCSVVCGTLMGVSVFSMMCSELLIISEIS